MLHAGSRLLTGCCLRNRVWRCRLPKSPWRFFMLPFQAETRLFLSRIPCQSSCRSPARIFLHEIMARTRPRARGWQALPLPLPPLNMSPFSAPFTPRHREEMRRAPSASAYLRRRMNDPQAFAFEVSLLQGIFAFSFALLQGFCAKLAMEVRQGRRWALAQGGDLPADLGRWSHPAWRPRNLISDGRSKRRPQAAEQMLGAAAPQPPAVFAPHTCIPKHCWALSLQGDTSKLVICESHEE